MRYLGSKNRIAKYIVPIIQSKINGLVGCNGYLEPFVGGANIIDKIQCEHKYGYDNNQYLIALLNHIRDFPEDIPQNITETEYNYVKNNPDENQDWYVGLVGFCSFGAKFFGGYRRSYNKDGTLKDETIGVMNNLRKQAPNLQGIEFQCCDFRNIPTNISNFVIYCDPPYRNTTKYSTGNFSYEEYYQWCKMMSKNNIVLCSEYWMPDDFECIWEGKLKCIVDKVNRTDRIEKLFVLKND